MKICQESYVDQNLTRIMCTLHEDLYTFIILYFSEFFLEWEMFQTKVVEKIKTHILCSIFFFFFFSENHAIYEMKGKKW